MFNRYMLPRDTRREVISHTGTFRGGKMMPVAITSSTLYPFYWSRAAGCV